MEKDITNSELLESINRGFSRIEEKMATKEELGAVKMELKADVSSLRTELKTNLEQIKTDLKSFKAETRENFERLEKNSKETDDITKSIITDYHPHIVALEEKVFGHSTFAEV